MCNRYRDTQTYKDTESTIDRSQPCETGSGLRAGKMNGVVTVYNKTITISCFILSYHIVIKNVRNILTNSRSHNVYSLSLMLPVRSFYYNC